MLCKWLKTGHQQALIITYEPSKQIYSGSSNSDHFHVNSSEEDASVPRIESFGYEKWYDELDYLTFSRELLSGVDLSELFFEETWSSQRLDEAKLSSSTFIYHKPSGKLYLNSNGVEAGWSDNNTDLPFLELIGSPELSADNIKVIVDDHEYRIPSTSDNSGSTIPYSMHADEYQARHLWESSGRDNVIKYFIDKNGAYGNHRAMPKKGFKYIRSALRLIDENIN